MREELPIRSSKTHFESVEIRRGDDDWYWTYRNERAGLSLRSNDDFGSLEAAERSASVAYPELEPIVLDPPDCSKPPSGQPSVSRPSELRRLLGIAAGIAAAVGLARWRGRAAADR